MSKFLEPQLQIPDILSACADHSIFLAQFASLEQRAKTPISPYLFSTVYDALRRTHTALSSTEIASQNIGRLYYWTQTDNVIRVTCPWDPSFSACDISISESQVVSPVICGTFFGAASEFSLSISPDETTVTLDLTVDSVWPILIVGGSNIDAVSLFYLGVFASREGLLDSMEELFFRAASQDFPPAISTLAYLCSKNSRNDEAFYWFVRLARVVNDTEPLLIPACYLLQTERSEDVFLAESILVEMARSGSCLAFCQLGSLHTRQTPGFAADPALAASYFEYAIKHFNDREAKLALANMYARGNGVERDLRRAIALLRSAGLSQQDLEKLEAQQRKPEFIDYSLAVGIIAGLSALLVFGWKWMRKR
jgi:hypothetical protein